LTTVAAVSLTGGCGFAAILGKGDGQLRFSAADSEILPLPSHLNLVSADHCASGGSADNCTAIFVVTSTTGADRPSTVLLLVDHLRRLGWPLQPGHTTYSGCRDVGGILTWTPHCMWLYVDTDPSTRRSPTDKAVIVYIDNLGSYV